MYNLRSRTVTKSNMPETGDKGTGPEAAAKEEQNLDELLVTLNRMTQVMEISSKRGNNSSSIPMESFCGNPCDDANQWIEKFEAWIGFNGWKDNNDKIISAMQLKLDGNALSWFKSVPTTTKRNSGQLFQQFRDHFGSIHPTWILEQQLYDRCMVPGENLEDYIIDIQRRCRRLNKTDGDTVIAFIRGLNASIRLFVIQKNPRTLQEAIQAARLAQESMTAFPNMMKDNTSAELKETLKLQQETITKLQQSIDDMQKVRVNAASGRKPDQIKCQLCGGNGHDAKVCRKFDVREKGNSQSGVRRQIQCWECKGYGHIARDCPGN